MFWIGSGVIVHLVMSLIGLVALYLKLRIVEQNSANANSHGEKNGIKLDALMRGSANGGEKYLRPGEGRPHR